MNYRLSPLISIWISNLIIGLMVFASGSARGYDLANPWPNGSELAEFEPEPVRFPSKSPFALNDIEDDDEVTEAVGYLFMPTPDPTGVPAPAVVMLHGAGGVMQPRELTYGRQFAAMGVAALVIDVFAARRDLASGFTDRLLNITETMFLADAFAGRDFLAAMPEIDGERIALIGFSYGGMAATYAAHELVSDAFANGEAGFAAHVSFYAPCIVTFEDPQPAPAPLLMLYGALDEIIDVERCRETEEALRSQGGRVEAVVFDEGFHQWDGWSTNGRRLSRGLADCHLRVEPDLDIHDDFTGLPMSAVWNRTLILAMCVDDEGYVIKRDDTIRERSNAILGTFLNSAFSKGTGGG